MTINVYALLLGVWALCCLLQNISARYVWSSMHFWPLIYKYKHINMRILIPTSAPPVVGRKWTISAANVLCIAEGRLLGYYTSRNDSWPPVFCLLLSSGPTSSSNTLWWCLSAHIKSSSACMVCLLINVINPQKNCDWWLIDSVWFFLMLPG
jgi:hypothetical protein